jgi:hypothetical protein
LEPEEFVLALKPGNLLFKQLGLLLVVGPLILCQNGIQLGAHMLKVLPQSGQLQVFLAGCLLKFESAQLEGLADQKVKLLSDPYKDVGSTFRIGLGQVLSKLGN